MTGDIEARRIIYSLLRYSFWIFSTKNKKLLTPENISKMSLNLLTLAVLDQTYSYLVNLINTVYFTATLAKSD